MSDKELLEKVIELVCDYWKDSDENDSVDVLNEIWSVLYYNYSGENDILKHSVDHEFS